MKTKVLALALIGAILGSGLVYADHQRNVANTKTVKQTQTVAQAVKVTKDQAVEIAKKQAGVKEIKNLQVKLEKDDGRLEYDIEFVAGGIKYEFDVDAVTGKIWEESAENDDDNWIFASPSAELPNVKITREKAVEIAKKRAGVTNITNLRVETEFDNGRYEYDIEFVAAGVKYEYDVDAMSGALVEESIERAALNDFDNDDWFDNDDDDDDFYVQPKQPTQPKQPAAPTVKPATTLTRDQALAIALKHAGVSNYRDLDIELDRDGGRLTYEIDFEVGHLDYEYEIDAVTGAILSSKID